MENLNNIAVIVTGGASGMGAQTARFLANKGAKVAIFDLNVDKAKKLAAEINGIAVECNVADSNSAEQAVTFAKEVHGPARICINCAGIAPAKRMIGREGPMPLDDFMKVIN